MTISRFFDDTYYLNAPKEDFFDFDEHDDDIVEKDIHEEN